MAVARVVRLASLVVCVASFAASGASAGEATANVETWAKAFEDGDVAARTAAYDELLAAGASAATPLAAIAGTKSGPSRRGAAVALGLLGADAAPSVPQLVDLVGDATPTTSAAASRALARIVSAMAAAARASTDKKRVATPADVAVANGVDWLARHQEPDGSWSCADFARRCTGAPACGDPGEACLDAGVTGLAAMAMLRAGSTHRTGPRATNVAAALKYFRKEQMPDGAFGRRVPNRHTYCDACASLALAEAYRRTGDPRLEKSVRSAVDYCLAARDLNFGWRYDVPPDGQTDTSVTAWMVKFLDAADDAGIEIDAAAAKGVLKWIDQVTDDRTGRVGYDELGRRAPIPEAVEEKFTTPRCETMTAAALGVRLALGRTRDVDIAVDRADQLLAFSPPRWDESGADVDLCYWLHGVDALHRTGGPTWSTWRRTLPGLMIARQAPPVRGCARGSWDACDPWSPAGGRVYATSVAVMFLAVAAEDPDRRVPITKPLQKAVAALEKAALGKDAFARRAAIRSLEAVRDSYR